MIWPLVNDFRCPFNWNDIVEVVADYEKWYKLGEWGPEFEYGAILRHRRLGILFCRLFCDAPAVGYGHGDFTVSYEVVESRPVGYDWREIGVSRP